MKTVPALSDYGPVLERHRAAGHLIYNATKDGPLFYVRHRLANGTLTQSMELHTVYVRSLQSKGDERRALEAAGVEQGHESLNGLKL